MPVKVVLNSLHQKRCDVKEQIPLRCRWNTVLIRL